MPSTDRRLRLVLSLILTAPLDRQGAASFPSTGGLIDHLVVADQGALPHLKRGDIVAVEPDPDPPSGSLVVARFPGEPYPLVRARLKLNGKLLYLATNPEWNWWYLSDDPDQTQVEVLGRVRSILYRRF